MTISSDPHTDTADARTESRLPAAPRRHRPRAGTWIMTVLLLLLAAWWLAPKVITAVTTVSTDDAYVNGHATFVAPRVQGQVIEVRVEDNNLVRRGDVLVRLDREPYKAAVNVRNAALEYADANLAQARARARSIEAAVRAARFELQAAIDSVNATVATLRQRVAELEQANALLATAQQQFDEIRALEPSDAASRLEMELKRDALARATAGVRVADDAIRQTRAALSLPPKPPAGQAPDAVPDDVAQSHPAVQSALSGLMQQLADLGAPLPDPSHTPDQVLAQFRELETTGRIEAWARTLVDDSPTTRVAVAQRDQAARALELAELDLKYTDIVAEFDGVVSRRNVNVGDVVQPGQSLLAIRASTGLWVDANFKETQLRHLRIGQRVDCYTDAYGDRRVFKGRISGFSMGTGATLSLLPAENATGNFVKVVQRLPVRIELEGPFPEDAPLFIGLSVTPYVRYRDPPTGPNAGRMLPAPVAAPTIDQP